MRDVSLFNVTRSVLVVFLKSIQGLQMLLIQESIWKLLNNLNNFRFQNKSDEVFLFFYYKVRSRYDPRSIKYLMVQNLTIMIMIHEIVMIMYIIKCT